MNDDRVIGELSALSADAPAGLIDRIAARWARADSPIGEVFVAYTDHGIAFVRPMGTDAATEFRERAGRPLLPAATLPGDVAEALRHGGQTDVDVDLRTVTSFQAEVLRAARSIPKGQVRPYAWVAAEIGRPKAVRAVGTALAINPVPLIVPCHRVVRSDGEMGQYIFGADTKRRLLDAEHTEQE